MEKTKQVQEIVTIQDKHCHPFRQRMMEKIKAMGYEAQHQQLAEMGYERPMKNLKFLMKFNGDLPKVIEKLKEKSQKHQEEERTLLEETGYEGQIQQLREKGLHAPTKWLLKTLVRFEGDADKTFSFISKKRERCAQRGKQFGRCLRRNPDNSSRSRSRDKMHKFGEFQEQMQILEQKGLMHPKKFKMIKLLTKFAGDLTLVEAKIQKKIAKGKWATQMKDFKEKHAKIDLAEYPEQVTLCVHQGILKPKDIEKIISVNQKDNQKILEFIEKYYRGNQLVEDQVRRIINATGIVDVKKIQKQLKKNNGNETAVIDKLREKQRIKIALHQKYTPQIPAMVMKGVKKLPVMYKALEMADGDVEKAWEHVLQIRKERGCGFGKFGKFQECFIEDFQAGEAKYLFVDGNNLLFVNDQIRQLYLKQKNKKLAEQILIDVIRNWGIAKNCETFLVFDHGSVKKIVDQTNAFTVESARPQFETSDDFLVDRAGKMTEEEKRQSVFVTSDRGLVMRLKENGISKVMKSKKAFESVKKGLGDEVFELMLKLDVTKIE